MVAACLKKLQSVLLFDNLDTIEIQTVLLCLNARVKHYKKNEYIQVQGEPFTEIGIILEGQISLVKEWADGACSVIDELKQYNSFGEDVICSRSKCCPYSVLAQTDVVMIYIDGPKLISSESTNCKYRSQINLNMLKCMAEYSLNINKKAEYSRIISVKKRVATFIYDIYKCENTKTFSIGMNREQMASYLNATRPAVSKILMQYKKDHIIQYSRDLFTVIDEEKLIREMN